MAWGLYFSLNAVGAEWLAYPSDSMTTEIQRVDSTVALHVGFTFLIMVLMVYSCIVTIYVLGQM